jgi:predicted enzyme related to lactoylglutathione lyase
LITASAAFAQAPPPGPAPAGIIAGVGNFSHIVPDLDKSFAFYRDVIGLEVNQAPQMFAANPAIMDMGNTPGAQSRIASFRIPGSQLGLELIEYKDIDRKPVKPRFQDPGAGNLMLSLRDLDSILAKIKTSEAKIQTMSGKPVENPGSKIIFVQDPDGFFMELNQRVAPAGAPEGNIIGGAPEIMVESMEQTMKLWKEVLKFDMSTPTEWDGRAEMVNTVGAPGSQFRRSVARIPGTSVQMIFLEFRNIDRKKVNNRTQDPGQSILQVQTTDLDGLMSQWTAAGGTVVSKDGKPASLGAVKLVLLKDTNGVMVEVLPARGPGQGKGKGKQ